MSRLGAVAVLAVLNGLGLALLQPANLLAYAEVAVVGLALGWWLSSEGKRV